ncbi:hypothetical protein [Streptomyces lunaelactis]|uniref:hypothetical protein n=1 Tax=Streptomyces lunaelactis TaxID=1535768 RepID=UPI0020C77105|nr:hypothetical protein [Streptomyces lunaelactis]
MHELLCLATHNRLAEVGPAPLWILPHLRQIEPARSVLRWHDGDRRYRALRRTRWTWPAASTTRPVAGSENGMRLDSQKLCHEVLADRQP